MNLFELYATIGIKMDEFERGLSDAKSKFESFSGSLSSVGEKISGIGSTLTKGLSTHIVDLGTSIIKTGADYEAGMSKVQAISGATAEEMTMLGEEAMRMASKTKFSTKESAEAYQYMAMAGWKAGDMVDGLSGIMNLAAASGENLGTTSDIVTDALTAFGLKASDSGRFADVLAAASNNANTNVSMLGESFKYVAPVAGAMGYSVEDVSVALGLMANSGIKASQAGTTLRTAITNMASPTSNMTKVMDEYGISLTDTDGSMLSLSEIMNVLRERMGGLDEATQASAASTLFGKEAMSGMLAIINAAPKDFNKLTEAINNSSGTTEEMARIMNDNASGAFERLESAVNVLFTQLSEHLIPIFTSVVKKVTEAVNWFGQLDEGTQKLILTIAGIAAVVGPVLVVIGNIITAVGKIGSAISGVIGVVKSAGSAISGLFAILAANPIAAVIAAVAALVAGLIVLWNTNEGFRDAVKSIWEAITGFFQDAVDAIKSAWEGIKDFFSDIWNGIKGAFEGVADFFGGIFRDAADAVQGAWEAVVSFFSGIWDGIKNVFSSVSETLGGFFSAAWEAIKNAWSGVTDFFSGVWKGIQDVFSSVADVLGGFFSDAWDAVKGAWDAAKDFFGDLWSDIKEKASDAASAIKDKLKEAWDGIKSAWGSAKEFFGGLWSNIKEKGKEAAENVKSAFEKAWSGIKSVWEGAKGFFSGVWNNIKGVFSNAGEHFKSIGSNLMNGLKNGVKEKASEVKNAVGNVVNGIKNVFTGKKGFDEHSPSKWSNKVFRYLLEGGIEGLDAGAANLLREVGTITEKVKSGMDLGVAPIGLSANTDTSSGALRGQGATGQNPTSSLTVNIYSPEKTDAVQAAREWGKTSQRMAMGLI